MTLRDFFIGAYGGTVSSLMILLILLLTLSISIRLMLDRRKKAYYSLTFSILLYAAMYLLFILLGNRPEAQRIESDHYLVQGLLTLSFILLNFGLYQLYNTTRRKASILATTGIFLTFVIMALRHYAATHILIGGVAASTAQTHAFLSVWMDLYVYGLIFFCFYFITPAVGQTLKYQIALVAYFLTHSAHVLNVYVYGNQSASLTFAENYLPLAFFFVIFQFIFDRVLELMQAVYHSSITDGLTGLFNRRYFNRRLNQYLQHGIPVSVIFADIDNFKKINDTHGHQRGDAALRQVASIVMEVADGIGIHGRFGGEEMLILLPGSEANPSEVAEKLRARVEAETGVTVSVGWSKSRKGVSAETLLKQADEAMYISKTGGKNRVTGFRSASQPKKADVSNV
jgi:diguanylate cyclase (GGDEF)-like protein